jgi:tungstate transport system ATP-binding protein
MRALASDLPIRFDDVSVSSGGVTMLDGITLQFDIGAPTVLIGPNGSGKTTLLRTAMGLVAPTQGRITWGGVEKSPPIPGHSCSNVQPCRGDCPAASRALGRARRCD